MKKTMLSLLLATLLLLPALAFADIGDLPTERQQPLLVDEGDILTDSEEASLLAMLERISAEQKCDIVIVVPRSLGYKSATEYADDWYDLNGFGYGSTKDGILLMVCMEERDWATSTAGAAQDWFDDYTLERIESRVVSNLSNGSYYDAFTAFAEGCEQTLQGVDRRPVLYLDDAAGFLTETEKITVERTLESTSHVGWRCDFVVLTANGLAGQTPSDYVNGVYVAGDYRHGMYDDKVVLLVDREQGKCYCLAAGEASEYFTTDDLHELETTAASRLSGSDAAGAFTGFAKDAYRKIEAYNIEHTPTTPTRSFELLSGPRAFLASIAGVLSGLFTALGLKNQLKSVKGQTAATSYLKKNSMQLTAKEDLFLYRNVSKVVRSSDSGGRSGGHSGGSSHFSSSGVSHGGHSGKF
ncbi:MAG: TPM domain-containing protein [Clostridia bacterium]|nr:TPM domain-containing protein [Clostridia bacterium]